MELAFISGPYRAETTHGIVKNIRNAEAIAIELWGIGYAVICPHKNTALFDGLCNDSVWLQGDLEIMCRCDLVVTVPGWQKSGGSIAEISDAKSWGIPVYHWPDQKEELAARHRGSHD